MKRMVIAAALVATCLATPAAARDGALYIELDGGVMKVEDFDFDVGAINNAVELENDDFGYDFGGIAGYDFGAFRVEAEVGYRGINNTDIETAVGVPVSGTLPGQLSGLGSFNAGGDATVFSLMANALVDFGDDDGLQFFAGGGVGRGTVDIDTTIFANGPGFLDDDDSGFAWQALAGVRAPLSDSMDVGVKYRYFNVNNVDFTDTAGRDIEGKWRSHSLMGTFTVNFGGREPMVEPVAAPLPQPTYTPPPPPPVYTPPPPPPPVERPAERG